MTGGAWSFGELIFAALSRATVDAEALERECLGALETGAATRYINGLRVAKVQNVCMIVGAFGILEAEVSSLDAYKGSTKPLQDLIDRLEQEGKADLAKRLWIFTKAVNVLKHGKGRSHDCLLGLEDRPPFLRVRGRCDAFFHEGDVSEVSTLIDVDAAFVAAASGVLREIVAEIDPWAWHFPAGGTEH